MDFLELAKNRYAVRKYEDKKVESEKLMKILEAGRIAPTGANKQPQSMIVIQEAEGLEKLKKYANIFSAPLAIISCGDHHKSWKRSYDKKDVMDMDVSIVTTHMMLQATELGLGTVWVCFFNPEEIKKEFNLPDGVEPLNILVIGYSADEKPADDRHDTMRKPLSEIVHYEKY